MIGISLKVELPSLDYAKKIENSLNSVYRNAGSHLARCVRRHMRMLAAARHRGNGPSHFKPSDVLDPVVEKDGVTVAVTTPGISRAYHDIDIYPKEASALAIPLHASAYGMSPREINDRGLYTMFRIKKDGVPGNVLYRSEDDKLIPMFALTQHVHQNQDPSLMPTDQQMMDAAEAGAKAVLDQILK